MKTIGLVGGIGPHSTLIYYKHINFLTNQLLGKHHSAKIFMVSVDFEEIVSAIFSNRWSDVSDIMTNASMILQKNHVDLIAFCSNTLYKVAENIKNKINIPLIHILDPVISIIQHKGFSRIALLGTTVTMEQSFHVEYLQKFLDVEIVTPDAHQRKELNQIIFNELCFGITTEQSKRTMLDITNPLKKKGVQALVLACTELPIIFDHLQIDIPILNTSKLHSEEIVRHANKDFCQHQDMNLLCKTNETSF